MPNKSKKPISRSSANPASMAMIPRRDLKTEPLRRFCFMVGNYRQATDVDHIVPCH